MSFLAALLFLAYTAHGLKLTTCIFDATCMNNCIAGSAPDDTCYADPVNSPGESFFNHCNATTMTAYQISFSNSTNCVGKNQTMNFVFNQCQNLFIAGVVVTGCSAASVTAVSSLGVFGLSLALILRLAEVAAV